MFKVVLWIPLGRLGNIIFQYQALNNLFKNNVRIFGISNDLVRCIELNNKNINIIPVVGFAEKKIVNIFERILDYLVRIKLLTLYTPNTSKNIDGYSDEEYTIKKKYGFFRSIIVFKGFFQHDQYITPRPVIKSELLGLADKNLKDVPLGRRVAIHLRFGDYIKWSVFGKENVILPKSYYMEAIKFIESKVENPVFIIFSDDIMAAIDLIGLNENIIIYPGERMEADFAAISICSHAIISASTFSWWAAILIKNHRKIIIAPKYWAGFRSDLWHPKNIKVNSFKYIDVEK